MGRRKALDQVRALLGPAGRVRRESGFCAAGVFDTRWRVYVVGRDWDQTVSELRRTLQPAEEWKGGVVMPRETMSMKPKVVTDRPKLLAERASAIQRKPVGRETGGFVLRIRVNG